MANMLTIPFGVAYILLLCCCNKSEAKGLTMMNRTSMALAQETVYLYFQVNIPANTTKSKFSCYLNGQKVLIYETVLENPESAVKPKNVYASIFMYNSSNSGEYNCQYMREAVYWLILVRDVGYVPDVETESFVTTMLVVSGLLLLFSIGGSVFVFKWHKAPVPSEGNDDGSKKQKRKENEDVKEEKSTAESVYTALGPRQVSIYDVLNVDNVRRESTEKQNSKQKAKTSPVVEGNFESVYENY